MKQSTPNPSPNSAALFLRLEGPLQAWGGRTIGRFRRTESVPTKSGVIGLLGAALGLSRHALNGRLDELNALEMAVRVDRAGHVEEDFQTVGAGVGVLAAEGNVKKTAATGEVEAIISPREYLVDAGFLVVLVGSAELIEELAHALQHPRWPLFLGRKRCIPSTLVFAGTVSDLSLTDAVRLNGPTDDSQLPPDDSPTVRVVMDSIDTADFTSLLDADGEDIDMHYENARSYVTDRLVRLDPPVHAGRVVLDFEIPRPELPLDRPDLADPFFGWPTSERPTRGCDPAARKAARDKAKERCICCRFQVTNKRRLHAHHLTYVRRGREHVATDEETIDKETTENDDFVILCDECHAAVTMLEYQNGFGLNRIDPRKPNWRGRILAARESRRRHRDPQYPQVETRRLPTLDVATNPHRLIESIIVLKAGTSFADDAPGNVWLGNRHHVHQRLSMAFPQHQRTEFAAAGYGVPREEGGFLYRIEPGRVARIVVQSRILPDWGRACADADWLVAQAQPVSGLIDLSAFEAGNTLTFDVEANPVKRLRADGPEGRKGKRVVVRDEAALRAWFEKRAIDGGFQIIDDSLRVEPVGRITAQMRSGPNRHWDSVRFRGRLIVTDATAFVAVLTSGIGSAKAYGFGLIRVSHI